jgi:threonine dehydrogenase-like Zn-dependent dehydrogenase
MSGADRDYFNVNPEWLHKLPDTVNDMQGSLIEPFTCGFHAIQRLGGTNASETVVVSGGGTIGLVSAAAAIGMGAVTIVVDPLQTRRDIALRLGATYAVDPTAGDAAAQIRELTKGGMADLVVEASGHDASLAAALDYAGDDGRVAMVGINIGRKFPVALGQIMMKNLTVRGSIGSPGVWPAAIRFLERTQIDLSPIQTHLYPLDQAVQAFALGADSTQCIKVTLTTGALT